MKKLLLAFALLPSMAWGVTYVPDNQSIVANAAGQLSVNVPFRILTFSAPIVPTDYSGLVNFRGSNLTVTIPNIPAKATVEVCNYDTTPLTLRPATPIIGYSSSTLPGLNNGSASCLNLIGDGSQMWAMVAVPGGATTTSPPNDTLVLRVTEDRYLQDAQFNVYMDRVKINTAVLTATSSHASGASQTFSFTGTWGNGAHVLGIEFLNDIYAGPGQDVNLYIDSVSYDGSLSLGNIYLYNTGTQNLNIPAH